MNESISFEEFVNLFTQYLKKYMTDFVDLSKAEIYEKVKAYISETLLI